MEKLSVVIITFNEEKNIGRCIDSVKNVADEIIVLDSFSNDKTDEIATGKGAIVHQHVFLGYKDQKNKALEFANYNYVLFLDADEALDDKLKTSILHAKENFKYGGYTMNRCTNYCGKFIRHGNWYPDRKLRLFDKREARWAGGVVHEKVKMVSGEKSKVQHLNGDLLHYSYYTVEEHITRSEQYSLLSAQAYFQSGKRSMWFHFMINHIWNFTSGYFLKLGFLDGRAGYLIARIEARATFLKYKKLRELWRNENI